MLLYGACRLPGSQRLPTMGSLRFGTQIQYFLLPMALNVLCPPKETMWGGEVKPVSDKMAKTADLLEPA